MNILKRELPFWIALCTAIGIYGTGFSIEHSQYPALLGLALFVIILFCIFRVSLHADRLAEMLGEPYGTLILTTAATLIEVAVMVAAVTHGENNPTFIRDTIASTLFIILGGMMGLAILIGGIYHIEQSINTNGANMYLGLLIPLALLTLVLPNFTTSTIGPTLAAKQEIFIGCISLALYGIFLFAQTKRYRNYFDDPFPFGANVSQAKAGGHSEVQALTAHETHTRRDVLIATLWLICSLVVVVLLIEKLAIVVDYGYEKLGFPEALIGTTVAVLVLAPEWLACIQAAKNNHLQRALNVALGSGLATLSLSVPAMLFWVALNGIHIELGLHPREIVLLLACLWVAHVNLSTGRTNIMQGAVLFVLFVSAVFLVFNP